MRAELLDDPLLVGAPTIDGYRYLEPAILVTKVAEGGMGAVYRGVHLQLAVDVAVKVLKRNGTGGMPGMVERFRLEAQRSAQLNDCANVVRVHDFKVRRDGLLYLVMEYVDGESADNRIHRRKAPLPAREAATIIEQAAHGLAAAHALEIVHRDIKPGNILLSRKGHVKVADFGIACVREAGVSSGVTTENTLLGTPQYMAPELWKGALHAVKSSDIYALGVTLGTLLAGRLLLDGLNHQEVMYKAVMVGYPKVSEALPTVPPALADLVNQATAMSPADRPTIKEMIANLQAWLARAGGPVRLDGPAVLTGLVEDAHPTWPDLGTMRRQIERLQDDDDKTFIQPKPPPFPTPSPPEPRPIPPVDPTVIQPRRRWRVRAAALVLIVVGLAGAVVWGVGHLTAPDAETALATSQSEITRVMQSGDRAAAVQSLIPMLSRAKEAKQSSQAEAFTDATLAQLLSQPDDTIRNLKQEGQLWTLAQDRSAPACLLLIRLSTLGETVTGRHVPADRKKVLDLLSAASLLSAARNPAAADLADAIRLSAEAHVVSAELDREQNQWSEASLSIQSASQLLGKIDEATRKTLLSRLHQVLRDLRVKLPDLAQRRNLLSNIADQIKPLLDFNLPVVRIIQAESLLRPTANSKLVGLRGADDLQQASKLLDEAIEQAKQQNNPQEIAAANAVKSQLEFKSPDEPVVPTDRLTVETTRQTYARLEPALQTNRFDSAAKVELEKLIKSVPHPDGMPPVAKGDKCLSQLAVQKGVVGAIALMIERKEPLTAVDLPSGNTLLHQAVINGSVELIDLLVDAKKGNFNLLSRNGVQETPLHLAAKNGSANLIARLSTDQTLVATDVGQSTPLHAAIQAGQYGAAKALIDEMKRRGLPLETRDGKGNLPREINPSDRKVQDLLKSEGLN